MGRAVFRALEAALRERPYDIPPDPRSPRAGRKGRFAERQAPRLALHTWSSASTQSISEIPCWRFPQVSTRGPVAAEPDCLLAQFRAVPRRSRFLRTLIFQLRYLEFYNLDFKAEVSLIQAS